MTSLIDIALDPTRDSRFTALLLDVFLKSFVVLALAGGLCLGWRRAAAAARHWIWFLALAGLFCLPVFSLALPAWQRPLWAMSADHHPGNLLTVAIEFGPHPRGVLATSQSRNVIQASRMSGGGEPGLDPAGPLAARFNERWLVLAPAVWFAGFVLVLSWAAVGRLRLRAILRRAQATDVVGNPGRNPHFQQLCDRLRIRRPVTLVEAAENLMPMTWGSWRPVVLLPTESGRWPVERQRLVFLHELAHVTRWDCLTQAIATVVCALYWFNPLAWFAARRMCIERERACDDLVLNDGCKASDYATELVEMARAFRRGPRAAGIAMARSSRLERRIAAILDASRARRAPSALGLGLLCAAVLGLVAAVAAQKPQTDTPPTLNAAASAPWFDTLLRGFFLAKAKQARALAAQEKKPIAPEVWPYFEAGAKGDWVTATNLWSAMRKRAHQYEGTVHDECMVTVVWSPILETDLAWTEFANWEKKHVLNFGNDIIKSIPTGSIYFGGTDPGRGVITALSRSHADGDPFFTLTQNALADGLYLQYLRLMYGGRIYTPTDEDSGESFNRYVTDAQRRLRENQLRPGEDVKEVDGKVQVSGQMAVMSINALLARIIFDKNPDREFYIEESFPLEWMYPRLSPHGLIMKIHRQPLKELSDGMIREDLDYWRRYIRPMIGDWLDDNTPVQRIAEFSEKTYLRRDFTGFDGDPLFIKNDWPQRAFSKLRSSIAGIYAWRAENATAATEKQRMTRAADFAFRQAWVLCPNSPEAVFRYVNLLAKEKRFADALLVTETAVRFPPATGRDNSALLNLVGQLKQMQKER